MNKSLFLVPSCLFTLLAYPLVHCSSDDGPGGGGQVDVPAECQEDANKKPICMTDEFAVFVSPAGKENGAGTRTDPVNGIMMALSKSATKPLIFVCEGNYTEAPAIGRGIAVYGGLSCDGSWSYTGGATNVTAPGSTALTVSNASAPVTIADMSFTSPNASAPGGSSIAAWVNLSKEVNFRRVTLTAGTGADANQERTSIPAWPPLAPKGNDADGGNPGPERVNPCDGLPSPYDRSVGGAGGAKNEDGGTGKPPIAAKPAGNTGAGGDTSLACPQGAGVAGAFGAGGASSPDSAALGRVNASGYLPSDGLAGENGITGQGGGGGAGRTGTTAFGGSGGAGGCGGKGGAGGRAGGASIALLAFNTKVTLTGSKLHAGKGGLGGPGSNGQAAQQGNVGGKGAGGGLTGPGCAGAAGGHGGSGAGGNGGAGGASIDLAYAGPAPVIDGSQISLAATVPGWTVSPTTAAGGAAGEAGAKAIAASEAGGPGRPGPAGEIRAITTLREEP